MHKQTRKVINMGGSDFHRKCHIEGVPLAEGLPRSPGPCNMKYEQCVEISDDNEAASTNRRKVYIQEDPVTIKIDHKPNQEKIIPEPAKEVITEKPLRDNLLDKDYLNKPIIVDFKEKKPATPIKKINFILPEEEKKPLDAEQMDWQDYHQLGVIHKFMDNLESMFPSLCTTGTIGSSVEGRNLKILKISNSNVGNAAVWMDAGIHAREWIAPAVNTYIADHISRNFHDMPESIRNKDWYFLPVVNPDGYHYSHTTDRMWRKNRAWHGNHCVGVDLNRNFGVGWGGRGSSNQPTNIFYRGPRPFSEPESAAIRDIFLNSGIQFKVYITLHSYGQVIIFPYACSSALAPSYVRLLEGATAMSKAIYNTNGNTYKVGISRDVMYGAAGTSNDFAHGGAGIPYCYLIELRSKQHKFKLPKDQIEETGKEILNCVIALMEFVDNSKYNKTTDSDQKTEILVENKELFLNKSNSNVPRTTFRIRRKSSYDKKSNPCAKEGNTSLNQQSSYVRWTHLPAKKDDSVEKAGDSKSVETNESRDEFFLKYDSDIKVKATVTDTSEQNKDSIKKTLQIRYVNDSNDSIIDINNSFTKTLSVDDSKDRLLYNNKSYIKDCDSFVAKADINISEQTDSSIKITESFINETDSYMKNDSSFEKRKEFNEQRSNFYEIRNNLLGTSDTNRS